MSIDRKPLFAWSACLLGLALLLGAAAPLAASDLIINVSEEYGGFYRPGKWYPVIVSIDNRNRPGDRSQDFRGSLTVQSSSRETRQDSYQFVRYVEVPAASVQRFTVFVKMAEEAANPPVLQVRTDTGRLIQTHPLSSLQSLGKHQVLLLKISRTTRRLYFPMPRASSVNPFTQADVQPTNLPRHWAGYDPADMIVFTEWPEASLSQRETKALMDWVALGGTLVFLGGETSSSYSNAGDSELLPVRTSSSSQYMLSSLDRMQRVPDGADMAQTRGFLVSNAELKNGAEVIWDASGGTGSSLPIVVRKPHGRGQILFLAVDLESAHADLNNALMPYWMALMPLPNVVDWEYAFPAHRGKLRTLTRNAARAPNIVLIILICVLYTAIVGPVNFYLLGRYNKVQYAWVTVPMIVFLFSGLIYAFGTLTKGGKYIGREVTLFLGRENQRVVEERSLVGIFTPRADSYFVDPRHPDQTVADSDRWHTNEDLYGSELWDTFLSDTSPGFSLTSRTPTIQTDDEKVRIRNWSMSTFSTTEFEVRGARELAGALESDVRYLNSGAELWFEGTLRNRTGIDFRDSALFIGGRGLPLGAFAAGDEKRLTQEKTRRPLRLGEQPHPEWRRFDDIVYALTPTQNTDSDSDINMENARELLTALFRPVRSGSLLPPLDGRLVFIGLTENDELSVLTNFERNSGTRSIVMAIELNPVPLYQQFIVPNDMVQVRLQDYPSEQFGFQLARTGNWGDTYRLEISDAKWGIFSAELPFRHPGIRPTQVTNGVLRTPGNTDLNLGTGLYNIDSGQFVRLEPGTAIANQGSSLATPYSGRAWIQIRADKPAEQQATRFMTGVANAMVDRIQFEIRGTMTALEISGQ